MPARQLQAVADENPEGGQAAKSIQALDPLALNDHRVSLLVEAEGRKLPQYAATHNAQSQKLNEPGAVKAGVVGELVHMRRSETTAITACQQVPSM
jgi:hypothetical protein